MNHIPKKLLEKNRWYKGHCRNSGVALWSGEMFLYIRHKFGTFFMEEIKHPEDDNGYDLFYPTEKI